MPVSPPRKPTVTLSGNNHEGRNSSKKTMNRRRHNSCVDFTFCSDGATNGSKLVKLNTLFERIADRDCGGIREDRLLKLMPSNSINSIKFGHLQKRKKSLSSIDNSAITYDLHLISRGPFLAMFANESSTFLSALASNEKSEREGKKKMSRKKRGESHTSSETDTNLISINQEGGKKEDVLNPTSLESFQMVIPTSNETNQSAAPRCRANTAPTGTAEFMQLLKHASDDGSSSLEMYSYEQSNSYDDESTALNSLNLASNETTTISSLGPNPICDQISYNEAKQLSPKSRRVYRRSASHSDQSSIKSDSDLNQHGQGNGFSLNRPRSRSISSQSDVSVESVGSDRFVDSNNQFCPFSPSHNPYGGMKMNSRICQVVHRNSPSFPGHRRTPTPVVGDGTAEIECYENLLPDYDPVKYSNITSPSLTKTLTSDGHESSHYGDSWDLSSYSMSSGEDDFYYKPVSGGAISQFPFDNAPFNPEMHHINFSTNDRGISKNGLNDTCSSCAFLSSTSRMIRQLFPFFFKESSVTMVQGHVTMHRSKMAYQLPDQYSFPLNHDGFQRMNLPSKFENPPHLYPSPDNSNLIYLAMEKERQSRLQMKINVCGTSY
jgi:hypothetical protein